MAADHPSAITLALKQLSDLALRAVEHLSHGFRALTDLPALGAWLNDAFADRATRLAASSAFETMALSATIILALEWTVRRVLRRASRRAHVEAEIETPVAPPSWLRGLLLDLLPVAVAGVLGNALVLLLFATAPVARSVALGALNAYLGVRAIMVLGRAVLAPRAPSRRLVRLDDDAAAGALRTLRVLAVVCAFGFLGGEVAAELGVSPEVHESIQKLVALAIHLLLIVAVLRSRHVVAAWLQPTPATSPVMAAGRRALAATWHYLAVTAIAAWWLIWAWDVPDEYLRILRFVLGTGGVLIVAHILTHLLLQALDRRFERPEDAGSSGLVSRLAAHRRLFRGALRAVLALATCFALSVAWGLPAWDWFAPGRVGQQFGVLVLKIALLSLLTLVCWEAANSVLERQVTRLTEAAAIARASRLRTLQPILRIALVVVLLSVLIMTVLSEIGINIGPLLAGAGIFGVALGFGSQKLVQDFITGIFLLIEDAMDVGDWVTVAGVSGTVEHLSIRTVRLRAGDGSVYLIPFSAITSVMNSNRGVGNAAVSVSVGPEEDVDRVARVLEEIAREMRAEPAFGAAMQSDLELWGVDRFDGSMTTLAGQIVCTDGGRWPVQREFNRRLKKRCADLGIALGIPRQALEIAAPQNASEPAMARRSVRP